ncbi:MAG: ABC transporter ATP-binding protein [Candidatus Symbiodolus clandestinus]
MLALQLQNLNKVYANGVTALQDVNLQVTQGDFFALLGPNGAGKSTVIGIINSLVSKSSGKVCVFGIDQDHDRMAVKRQLGIVPQEFNFHIFETVEQIVVNQAGYYGLPYSEASQRANEILMRLQLWDKRHQAARTLSGGMKRRLMIARALIHRPKLLALDEPTAGVDIEQRRLMWQFLRELNADGTTIILTTHYLEEAEQLSRHLAIMQQGQITEPCTLQQLLSQLNSEIFVLDVVPVSQPIVLEGYQYRWCNPVTLEVTVARSQGLNQLFQQLQQQQIQVNSLRNQSNRLEQLLLKRFEQVTPRESDA